MQNAERQKSKRKSARLHFTLCILHFAFLMDKPRALIVNADDFGQSAGINRGVLEAHDHGIVTSASLMVCWPASIDAAALARSRKSLSIGLHVDIGEWIFQDGSWRPLYRWAAADDVKAVEREVRLQLERFRDLLGRDPTHIDSHQHVHRRASVHNVFADIAAALEVPLRHYSPIRYCGDFYGQSATGEPLPDLIATSALSAVLRGLPAGVTELACHPGYPENLESMYRAERRDEMRTLCADEIRDVIDEERITLVSFKDVVPE
jgi:predicted glycoside hydrolase/deacetylase ChbG (UPF0249 family)